MSTAAAGSVSRLKCQGCQDGTPLPFAFTMAFHPIVDLSRDRVWGYEALVRGTEGQGAGFILGQVDEANRYKFDQACRVKAIELAGQLFPNDETVLSINFMPNAVYEPAACIRATLEAARRVGFAHRRIMFEFTENERMVDVAHVQRIVAEYRQQGFLTALDDFGAGYAGLNLLASFQPDLIKLDMELIRGVASSRARQIIVANLISMARELGVTVLAEGIETQDELAALREAGIALFQGYLFAKPAIESLPPIEFALSASPMQDVAAYGSAARSDRRLAGRFVSTRRRRIRNAIWYWGGDRTNAGLKLMTVAERATRPSAQGGLNRSSSQPRRGLER